MYTARGTIDKSHLIEEYLPLVRRIALQMMARLPASVELDDLIQAGRIGLLDAWSRFEENTAATFETFASQRIRGAILDELRAMDWAPRSVRQSARQIDRAIQAAAHRAGQAPSEADIAAELKITLAEYHDQLLRIQGCQILYAEDLSQEDSDRSVFDQRCIPDHEEGGDPIRLLLTGEFRERLVAAIRLLPEREAQVLSLHYDDEMSMREISSILEVSPSRASQLHNQAIARLRASLQEVM